MTTRTNICNMAIAHLGIGKEIASYTSDQSEEARACRIFYDIARESVLKEHDWSFATKFVDLGLIEEDPTDEWDYSYRYPVDCLYARRVLSGMRQDTLASEIPFRLVPDNTGRLIYTDESEACLEYTYNVEDEFLFSADFALVLSFRLAAYIAPRITLGDPFSTKQEMLGQYALELAAARANDMSEIKLDKHPESEFIKVRS